MKLKSSAFEHLGSIPQKYTCEGKDINPPLEFVDVPPQTVSLVLIMDDPDVPVFVRKDQMWVHWIIYNIPPNTREIKENSTPPGIQGCGTGGEFHYQGPCPPDREHRYFFKLYALDTKLQLDEAYKEKIESAMKYHILEKAELIGLYCKKSNKQEL